MVRDVVKRESREEEVGTALEHDSLILIAENIRRHHLHSNLNPFKLPIVIGTDWKIADSATRQPILGTW